MKKRIMSLILAFCLLFVWTMPVAAAPGGRIEGVDYSRIEENSSLEKEVVFQVGKREFSGTLSNGKTLTPDEIDAIIRGVMTSRKVTSGMLIGAHQRASEGLQYNEGRYIQGASLAELVLAAAGVSSAQELSHIITGDSPLPSAADFYRSILSGTALNKLFDIALGAATGNLFSNLLGAAQASAEVGLREYYEYIEDNERVQQALAAALALEQFYALCNAEIKKAEQEAGRNQWSLRCAQTVWTKRELFGSVPVMQYWRLSCDLKRTNFTDDVTNWGGTYTGSMKLDIWHDMTAYDQQFLNRFFLGSGMPFSQMTYLYDYIDEYSQPSALTKTLTNNSFTIALDPGLAEGGEFEKPFSFAGFEDKTFFWSLHPISVVMSDAVAEGLVGGKTGVDSWSVQAGSATIKGQGRMKYNFVGELNPGSRGIHLDIYGWENISRGEGTGTAVGDYRWDDSVSGLDRVTVATDTAVFEDLRMIPTLTINGV